MVRKPENPRRWLGATCLLLAMGMLAAGVTGWVGPLGKVGTLVFWMICLALTWTAMIVALLDLSAIRRHARAEQRALLESTVGEIGRENGQHDKKSSSGQGSAESS